VILDTDVLSAIVSPRCPERVVTELDEAEGTIYTTAVTWGEIAYGLARHARGDRLRRVYETRVLPALEILAFDQECAEVYGRLRAQLEKRGERLGEADLMIAAITLRHDLMLVSGNTRHFSRVPGLKLVNWLEG
jgi:tRNA(fMet)-specific endonuclease VapC